MIPVNATTREAWLSDSVHKSYRIYFPELNVTFDNSQIVKETMSMSEGLNSNKSIEFVGCQASSFKIQLYNAPEKLKGKKIEAYVTAGETEEIALFKGIVDSVKIQANHAFKEIEAYDILYTAGNKNVASWYNGISYPTTLGSIRQGIENAMGLTVDSGIHLPNDDIVIPEKKWDNTPDIKASIALKSICQINGVFGAIRRSDGYFEYRKIGSSCEPFILGSDAYLGNDAYLSVTTDNRVGYFTFDFYKEIEYEEFFVKPVERVQIRDSEQESGITVGPSTGNKYIIQANIFAYDLDNSTLTTIANNILNNIKDVSFHPCKIKHIGIPFLEPGDVVTFPVTHRFSDQGNYNISNFTVISRTLSGDQILNDAYEAEGDEEQKEFITDIQAQLNSLKQNNFVTQDDMETAIEEALEDIPTMEEMEDFVDTEIGLMEEPTGFNVISCYTLPTAREPNTIYLVQGGIIMIR